MDSLLEHTLWEEAQNDTDAQALVHQQQARIERILGGANKVQLPFLLDESLYRSLRCPRRSGKSYAMSLLAVLVGESRPGSRILIVSLTLKSTKENFWTDAPSGIFAMNRMYELGLTFNLTDCTWHHKNGSRGRLAGAETRADIENLRGSAVEADLVLVDESGAFAPALLDDLLTNIIEPGLMTRSGTLVLGGTPGKLPYGPAFYSSAESARIKYKDPDDPEHDISLPSAIPYSRRGEEFYSYALDKYQKLARQEDADESDVRTWSLHTWTVQDNTAWPKQWRNALAIKRRKGWADDHPTWRREYLGEWITDDSAFVYAFASLRHTAFERVTWIPEVSRTNVTGLPPEDGPWHLVMGLDIGFEDDTAIVLAGYSERVAQFRVVYDYQQKHLTTDQLEEQIHELIAKYGMPECMVADTAGGGSKMLVETMQQRYGWPLVKAEKTQKNDHIELVNSDFHAGRIKVIPGSMLDHQLCALQWNLKHETKDMLARMGQLKEDPSCPNHLCDALLYSWRYSYHFWAKGVTPTGPKPGTDEWVKVQEDKEEQPQRKFGVDGYPGLRGAARPMTREDARWQTAVFKSFRS